MTDAVIYAWREDQGDVWTGEWALDRADKWVPAEANKYILATPTALAASPEVQALIAAEGKLWERAIANYCDMITIEDVEAYVAKAHAEAAAIRGETT